MQMNERNRIGNVADEQLLYARLLDWGAKIGLAVLVAGFAGYLSGFLAPQVPVDQLPALWTLPLADYLARTGTPTGWGWLSLLDKGEFAGLAGIAILSGCSLLCLVAVVAVYARRGDRVYATIGLLEIAVLVLAASGVLTAGH
jgi:hypothetical protein